MNLAIPRSLLFPPTNRTFPSLISHFNTWQSTNNIITCCSNHYTVSDKQPPLLPSHFQCPCQFTLRATCQAWLQSPSPSTSLPVPLTPLLLLHQTRLLAPTRTTCLPVLKWVAAQVSTLAPTWANLYKACTKPGAQSQTFRRDDDGERCTSVVKHILSWYSNDVSLEVAIWRGQIKGAKIKEPQQIKYRVVSTFWKT